MFEQNDYFFTFDLKSGYHHITMHPASIKYLGFQWTFIDGRHAYFQFSVLPFGLTSAGYIFTKVLRPLVKKWRTHGIKGILYLDDGINGHISKEEAQRASIIIASDLNQSGFLLNTEKSHLEPGQTGRWLGVLIDTTSMTFTVPPRKSREVTSTTTNCVSQTIRIRKILSVHSRDIILHASCSRPTNASSDKGHIRRHDKYSFMVLPRHPQSRNSRRVKLLAYQLQFHHRLFVQTPAGHLKDFVHRRKRRRLWRLSGKKGREGDSGWKIYRIQTFHVFHISGVARSEIFTTSVQRQIHKPINPCVCR